LKTAASHKNKNKFLVKKTNSENQAIRPPNKKKLVKEKGKKFSLPKESLKIN